MKGMGKRVGMWGVKVSVERCVGGGAENCVWNVGRGVLGLGGRCGESEKVWESVENVGRCVEVCLGGCGKVCLGGGRSVGNVLR